MALDSESRWRMIRMMRAKGTQPTSNETTIREAQESDLTQMVEIYNYYIQNSVVTFDMDKMKLVDWKTKYEWVTVSGCRECGWAGVGFCIRCPMETKSSVQANRRRLDLPAPGCNRQTRWHQVA